MKYDHWYSFHLTCALHYWLSFAWSRIGRLQRRCDGKQAGSSIKAASHSLIRQSLMITGPRLQWRSHLDSSQRMGLETIVARRSRSWAASIGRWCIYGLAPDAHPKIPLRDSRILYSYSALHIWGRHTQSAFNSNQYNWLVQWKSGLSMCQGSRDVSLREMSCP